MRVVCIDINDLIDHPTKPILSVGCVYYVMHEDDACYHIVDNSGTLRPYKKSRFKSYDQEIRNNKLKELGI